MAHQATYPPRSDSALLVPNYEDWLLEIMTRSDYDEYWKHPSFAPEEHWDNFPDWPMLFVGGWYDPYTRAVFENFPRAVCAQEGPDQSAHRPLDARQRLA